MSRADDLYPQLTKIHAEYTLMRSRLVKWFKELDDQERIEYKVFYNRRMKILDDEIDRLDEVLGAFQP